MSEIKTTYKSITMPDWQWNCISGKIRITDPEYHIPETKNNPLNLYGVLDNCAKGIWGMTFNVVVSGFSCGRIYDIYTYRCYDKEMNNKSNELLSNNLYGIHFLIGVQHGQLGFFDNDYFPDVNNKIESKKFHKICNDITNKQKIGIIEYDKMKKQKPLVNLTEEPIKFVKTKENGKNPMGFIVTSGWGDGAYKCFASYNKNNEIVGLYIQFIDRHYENIVKRLYFIKGLWGNPTKESIHNEFVRKLSEQFVKKLSEQFVREENKQNSNVEKIEDIRIDAIEYTSKKTDNTNIQTESNDNDDSDNIEEKPKRKKKKNKKKSKTNDDSDSDNIEEKPKRGRRRKNKKSKKDDDSDSDNIEEKQKRGRKKNKKKSKKDDDSDSDNIEEKPKRGRKRKKNKKNKK